jgi:hypothetical protein
VTKEEFKAAVRELAGEAIQAASWIIAIVVSVWWLTWGTEAAKMAAWGKNTLAWLSAHDLDIVVLGYAAFFGWVIGATLAYQAFRKGLPKIVRAPKGHKAEAANELLIPLAWALVLFTGAASISVWGTTWLGK